MSDDEYYYDEGDYFEWEGEPYSAVDALAENCLHSPVLVSYDPDWEAQSSESDWEYYSDEYFDEPSPGGKKRKAGESRDAGSVKKKWRRLGANEDIPRISVGDSNFPYEPVVWRSKETLLKPCQDPVANAGDGETVSLLKDWRERFHKKSTSQVSLPTSKIRQRKGSQQAIAVVIEDVAVRAHKNTPADKDASILPPTSLVKSQPSKSRMKVPPAYMNETSSTTAKQQRHDVLRSQKRKADLNKNDEPLGTNDLLGMENSHPPNPPSSKKQNVDTTTELKVRTRGRPAKASPLATKSSTPSIQTNALKEVTETNGHTTEAKGKRKAEDSGDGLSMPPSKKKTASYQNQDRPTGKRNKRLRREVNDGLED